MRALEIVEFYKMRTATKEEKVLETAVAHFETKEEFEKFAVDALPNRRGDRRIDEWPEAVRTRVFDEDGGGIIYDWSLWDQIRVKGAIANAGKR